MALVQKDWGTPATITAINSGKKFQQAVKPVGDSWARRGLYISSCLLEDTSFHKEETLLRKKTTPAHSSPSGPNPEGTGRPYAPADRSPQEHSMASWTPSPDP